MNKTLKAADEVRKLARMFQALGEIIPVLDSIGSLEQAEGEARARIDALAIQAGGLEAENMLAQQEAARILAEARVFADGLREEATNASATAKAESDRIAREAHSDVARMMDEAKAGVMAAERAAMEIGLEVKAKEKELAELNAKIEAARAQVAAILAG